MNVFYGLKQLQEKLTAEKGKGGKALNSYAVIGSPISHSMSPKLHSMLVKDCNYYAAELKADELENFCGFARENLQGFNITVPYKKDIIKYLDAADGLAGSAGSVNTVKVSGGRLTGYNTDIYGFSEAIKCGGAVIKGKKALVLGAGGVALSAVYALKEEGAFVTVAARDTAKAKNSFKGVLTADIKDIRGSFDITVNCTPCGMQGQEDTAAIDLNRINGCSFVFDTVYNPLKTRLIRQAESLGIKAANGLDMLIYQAARAQEIWGNIDKQFSLKSVRDALEYGIFKRRLTLKGKKGIALCGFMACGKSTAAGLLAQKYGMNIIETDSLTEKYAGMSVAEIFKEKGEKVFRDMESAVIKGIIYGETTVVSLGGGAVLRQENCGQIKENCVLIYIDIPLETALKRAEGNGKRPLLNSGAEEITRLYNYRKQIYESVCDIKLCGNAEAEKLVSDIIESI